MNINLLFNIGFLSIDLLDIIDILIFAYLLYQVYKLLRGGLAFNIFIGVVLLYAIWWLVRFLDMDLLSLLLGQFVSVGVIIIIIIFQPEIRRFLLILGNNTLKGRNNVLKRFLGSELDENDASRQKIVHAIQHAMQELSNSKTGALIVLSDINERSNLVATGIRLDAEISQQLIESIFNKASPLHDGAAIISGNRIIAASCILPLSESPSLPKRSGLRHRSAVGVTENTNHTAFIVSEETGKISYAHNGELKTVKDSIELTRLIMKYLH